MTRRIFLVGEGPSDIGGLAREPAFQTDDPGFVQPVVERLVAGRIQFVGGQLSVLGKTRVTGLKDAMASKAYRAALLASDRDADALIFVTDVDKGSGSNTTLRAERRIAMLRSAVEKGLDRAARDGWLVDNSIIATPCRTIEAWALGDLEAVRKVARHKKRPSLPCPPEQLWGEPGNPKSDHPKFVLRRILGGDGRASRLAAIAERAELKAVRVACPLSFEPFAGALETL